MKGIIDKHRWRKTLPKRPLGLAMSILYLTALALALGMVPFPGLASWGLGLVSQVHAAETDVPPDYKGKQMPAGWATDPKVIAAGKAIYEGTFNPRINCADCHGVNGKPTRKGRGAVDLSDPAEVQKPDDFFFWRISEGVHRTKMRGWKTKLTEEQRWQVIAYIRTLAQR